MGVETARLTPLPRWRHDEGPVPDAGMLPVLPALRGLLPEGLRRGTVVAVGGWEGAQARLLVARQEWAGIGTGHGRLRARRVQVVADGRGGAARARTRWLWLPGPDGSVGPADQTVTGMRDTG